MANGDENRWRPDCGDHDRLIILETQVLEYRNAMADRLSKLNELRDQVTSDREAYLRVDVYNAHAKEMSVRLEAAIKDLATRVDANQKSINELAAFPNRMLGIGSVLMVIAVMIGALIGHFWK